MIIQKYWTSAPIPATDTDFDGIKELACRQICYLSLAACTSSIVHMTMTVNIRDKDKIIFSCDICEYNYIASIVN